MQCRFGMMIPLSPRPVASVACRLIAHLQPEITASLRPVVIPDGQTYAPNWSKAANDSAKRRVDSRDKAACSATNRVPAPGEVLPDGELADQCAR
jgi:hypothetical protein